MTAVETWGAPLLFLIAFVNAIPFVSWLIPAEPLFAFAGTRLASGSGASWVLAAYLGAWVGCQCSFWLGRLAGRQFLDRRGTDGLLIGRIQTLYQRYGAFMVVIAQAIAPISTLAQAMAGVFGMRPALYAVVSLLGAAIEVGQYTLIGYLGATVLAAFGLTPGQVLLEWIGPYAALGLLLGLVTLGVARILRRGRSSLPLRAAYATVYTALLVAAVSLGSLALSTDRTHPLGPVPLATACRLLEGPLIASAGSTALHRTKPINIVLASIDPEILLDNAGWLRSPTLAQRDIDVIEHIQMTWAGLPPASTLLLDGRATALAWQEDRGVIPRVKLRLWPVETPAGAPPIHIGAIARIDGLSLTLDGWLPTLGYDLEADLDPERDRVGQALTAGAGIPLAYVAGAKGQTDGAGYQTDGRVLVIGEIDLSSRCRGAAD